MLKLKECKEVTWIKHNNPKINGRISSAAYNFVELPDKVVKAVENADELPNHNTFSNSDYPNTGHFIVKLTTKTPLYIRSPLTPKESEKKAQEIEGMNFMDKLGNKPDFFYTNDSNRVSSATIPGSSLRGMLRNLLEILSYSKISIVQNKPKTFYRAVAAPKDDSLGNLYKEKIKSLQVGYLKKKENEWFVKPAQQISDLWQNVRAEKPYLSIKDSFVNGKVSNFLEYNNENYKPQIHKIKFDAQISETQDWQGRNVNYVQITNIGDSESNYVHEGFLVCSGNMLENDSDGNQSPREKHTLILPKNLEAAEIKIQPQAVLDYKGSLTDFLKETPFDKNFGCLKENQPVFYIIENDEVCAFGHTPNFRLPAIFEPENRASTPLDFVPKELREVKDIDFAEAIFGFTKKDGKGKEKAYASRVYFSDAKLTKNQSDIFLEVITPPILATPKPTAFQHYLVQNSEKREELKHFASETPKETVIRGHKLYWHRGIVESQDLKVKPNTPKVDSLGKVDEKSKVHTQFKPAKCGITFEFKVYFENLSNEELGALCWALNPNGETEKSYFHKLGMGKAFGMGAVCLEPTLFLSNRQQRYETLFDGILWRKGENKADDNKRQSLIDGFETYVRVAINSDKPKLSEIERIKILLKMLEWNENPDLSFKNTPDFEAEDNDFEHRRILPTPLYAKPQTIIRVLKKP
jgi:CRISPR-associated protein (TIGR03986 family)